MHDFYVLYENHHCNLYYLIDMTVLFSMRPCPLHHCESGTHIFAN